MSFFFLLLWSATKWVLYFVINSIWLIRLMLFVCVCDHLWWCWWSWWLNKMVKKIKRWKRFKEKGRDSLNCKCSWCIQVKLSLSLLLHIYLIVLVWIRMNEFLWTRIEIEITVNLSSSSFMDDWTTRNLQHWMK